MSNLNDASAQAVPDEVVRAAVRVSRARGVPVAGVPLIAVAEEAGISRSTLMRRLGGSRRALDEAVRAAGVDPGGQRSVRERAVEAAAELVSEQGLVALTLERVAGAAQCSVHSLYAVFGGRDGLLQAVYERHSAILDVEAVLAGPREDLPETVRTIYRLLVEVLNREPRVMPAMLADALSRPDDPAVSGIFQHVFSRVIDGVGQWLTSEIAAGRIRDMPPLLLVQQMTGPLFAHFVMRYAGAHVPGVTLPTSEEAVEVFTRNFLKAVAVRPPDDGGT
ncbi:TetR/AcrR family transcriptional regulator [Streptomyces sp. MNU89]|uniref:TetR/AcrR family transcriptional regulator n=1 Tax=Streptomyces sp. MNU89 TaxID=2560025 RepID=UPI001E5D6594|nr:TetR/AcrR family transcriptional regulator [Streptomyces sp. MNU89]MCC9737976.1 TetR/AcrR family transcriptional regulator [Streptomyces sp. MNU89]